MKKLVSYRQIDSNSSGIVIHNVIEAFLNQFKTNDTNFNQCTEFNSFYLLTELLEGLPHSFNKQDIDDWFQKNPRSNTAAMSQSIFSDICTESAQLVQKLIAESSKLNSVKSWIAVQYTTEANDNPSHAVVVYEAKDAYVVLNINRCKVMCVPKNGEKIQFRPEKYIWYDESNHRLIKQADFADKTLYYIPLKSKDVTENLSELAKTRKEFLWKTFKNKGLFFLQNFKVNYDEDRMFPVSKISVCLIDEVVYFKQNQRTTELRLNEDECKRNFEKMSSEQLGSYNISDEEVRRLISILINNFAKLKTLKNVMMGLEEEAFEKVTLKRLIASLPDINNSPKNYGTIKQIVIRPNTDEREAKETAVLKKTIGVKGDNYFEKPCSVTKDKLRHPEREIAIVNWRVMQAISPDQNRIELAGDQLYVDFDISKENCPPGTRLRIGEAVIEITSSPHNPCKKFSIRFGPDATRFTARKERGTLLRGVFAKVIKEGEIKKDDKIIIVNSFPCILMTSITITMIFLLMCYVNSSNEL